MSEVRALFVFRWIVSIIAVGLMIYFAVMAGRAVGAAEEPIITAGVVRSLIGALVTYLSARLLSTCAAKTYQRRSPREQEREEAQERAFLPALLSGEISRQDPHLIASASSAFLKTISWSWLASTMIRSPCEKVPLRISSESGFSTSRWIARRKGRPPKSGS